VGCSRGQYRGREFVARARAARLELGMLASTAALRGALSQHDPTKLSFLGTAHRLILERAMGFESTADTKMHCESADQLTLVGQPANFEGQYSHRSGGDNNAGSTGPQTGIM